MASNADRIIEALRLWPGLDDDALELQADVHPRQQVNQICRRLEQQGVLRRTINANGKIGNFLVASQSETSVSASAGPSRVTSPKPPELSSKAQTDHVGEIVSDLSSTLFIIPCSSEKKEMPEACERGPSLLDILPPALAQGLKDAREAMRARAHVDDTTLVPAWRRYGGGLYKAAARALADLEDRGLHMIIVSGGYGLVLAREPIGNYDALFRLSAWPRGLLEDVLLDYLRRCNLRSVRAIASRSGDYRKLLTRITWSAAGADDALLLSPQPRPGAMVLSPRAQGEALTALLHGTMHANWLSSDGLCLDMQQLR